MKHEAFWRYRPPSSRDITRLVAGTPTSADLDRERQTRARILQASGDKAHRKLGRALAAAEPGKPLPLGCCPHNLHRFRRWAVSRALRAIRGQRPAWLVTFAGDGTRLSAEDLGNLPWGRLHYRLRRRLERALPAGFVAIGVGDLEWSEAETSFFAHHHVVLAGVHRDAVDTLRRAYPAARAMKVQALTDPARQIAYALKFNVFRRPLSQRGPRRPRALRLRPREFCAHMAHLSENRFSAFIFCKNTRLDGR